MKRVLFLIIGITLICAGFAVATGKTHWGYSGHAGPEHWGELSEEYAVCGSGKNQSPIDLSGMIKADLETIKFDYKDTPLEVVNNGHTVKVSYAEGSSIEIDGTPFKLLQFHFHTPSENLIDGKSFPMEAHLVHSDNNGNLAVVSVMFSEGQENEVAGTVKKYMSPQMDKVVSEPDISVNVMNMLPGNKDYYRFNGSLTTPPCTEGVRWLVMKAPVEVSKEQIEKFHEIMHDNNRPVQSRYARPVLK